MRGKNYENEKEILYITITEAEKIYEIPTRIPRKKIHKSKNRKTKFHNFVKFEIDNIRLGLLLNIDVHSCCY